MKIRLNPDRINNIKNLAKKYVLITSISAIIISTPITEAKAEPINNTTPDIQYYQISDDKDYIYIENSNDLSIIKDFPNLTEITLENCSIDNNLQNTNISILTLKNSIFNNQNIEFPSSITELEIDNTLINYDSLKSLPYLKKITFKNLEFDSLIVLKDIPTLEELNFDSCNIGILTGIENLTNIKSLSFVDTGIESIEQLKSLNKLNSLTLSQTFVSDLSPIKDSNISFLDITDSTNIKNLNIITEMKNLSTLIATNCEMSYTEEIIKHIEKENIYSNISTEGLVIQNKINSIINQITTQNMSIEEKIEKIVEFVTNNLEYDNEVYNNPELLEEYNTNSLKYALNGIGCCKNYTALTTALLRSANINGYEQKNDEHIWNIVELEGNYYYIDSTFIDNELPDQISDSSNFMANQTDFSLEHNSMLIPSKMYNKIHNIMSSNENKINNNELEANKLIITKKIALGGIVGIAIALNSAFIIKKISKNKKTQNKKL